jgi:hypothetical protein
VIPLRVDYATPSAFTSDWERAQLGLSPNLRRPLRFHGRIREHVLSVRLALQALGALIWSDDSWATSDEFLPFVLDPVVTVHRDRVFFEAFSQDQSAYGLVIVDRELFETEGEVECGTTNVDFTAWLWAALGEMRSSRDTWLRIEKPGIEVRTEGAGGRFEQKVELPDAWVRGFLQLQGAMALPGTRLTVRPVDLVAALRFLHFSHAKVSPRALRYVFEPGQPAALVLEPWEERFVLRGAEHGYDEPRSVRTWGRRRLRLLEPLLPYANKVDVFLKGRALPSFYAVELPGVTWVLGLTGWSSQRFTGSGSFDLLTPEAPVALGLKERVLAVLRERQAASVEALAQAVGADKPDTSRALFHLCRAGMTIFDVQRREYRHRELFETPVDEERLFPPDLRRERAGALLQQGLVRVESVTPRETRKIKRLPTPEGMVRREVIHRDLAVVGAVAEQPRVELVLNDEQRLIFATCGCDFFLENILNQGPCEHMLALLTASAGARRDAATSAAVPPEAEALSRQSRSTAPEEGGSGGAGEELDGEES